MVNETINLLNTLIATESVLTQNIKNFHWNIRGSKFLELHSFFEELYNSKIEIVDELAERIRAKDEFPISSFSKYLDWSLISEEVEAISSQDEILEKLENSYRELVKIYREFIGKVDEEMTADMLVEINSKHELNLWKISSLRA